MWLVSPPWYTSNALRCTALRTATVVVVARSISNRVNKFDFVQEKVNSPELPAESYIIRTIILVLCVIKGDYDNPHVEYRKTL